MPAAKPDKYSVVLPAVDDEQRALALVLARAFDKYVERNEERKSGWKRAGVRGMANQIYSKAERGFIEVMTGNTVNDDNYIDLIVYACFALLLDGDLNGDWPWPGGEENE
jgi:hypothetical protein